MQRGVDLEMRDEISFGTTEETLAVVNEAIKAIEAGVFEGVIVVSKGDHTSGYVHNGDMDDRLRVVDMIFEVMYRMRETGEPNITAFELFMQEMYKRFKYYFSKWEEHLNV